MSSDFLNAKIDEFIEKSKALIGQEINERECWNTVATQDAIRHFAYGISDDNPLWINPQYARKTYEGRQPAPPSFLTSVLYPALHGEPMEVPLSSLIGDLEYHWYAPIFLGDSFCASAKIVGIYESKDRAARRLVYILSETCYWNQHEVLVGKAFGTMVRYALAENDMLLKRSIYEYSDEELQRIAEAQTCEYRRGKQPWTTEDLEIGQELPPMVRGPLTVGDLICWQAGIGPSYRPGALGYVDNLKAPHNAVKNPVTGWPVKYSQQHEDFLLASQRGMPAPFDNGVMRLAWVSPMLTNWIGDSGTLKRLSIQMLEPNLYGDTTWYRGVVVGKALEGKGAVLKLNVSGINQLNIITTKGTAEVFVPLEQPQQRRTGQRSTSREFLFSPNESLEKAFVHELFEAQVLQSPDSLALSCEQEWLTYEVLNQCANQLAHHLRALGVGPEMAVGILLERSVDVIVAMLGILKAGGAYLFIDTQNPIERLAFMLKDAQVQVLITQEGLKSNFPEFSNPIVFVDSEKKFTRLNNQTPVNLGNYENLAYCIYTSGSTNEPKRVGVPHASFGRYVNSLKQSFNVDPGDIYLQTASFAFSASTRQIFLPLCVGATLHLATTEQQQDPFLLYDLICTRQITIWDTVPSVWRNCVETVLEGERDEEAFVIMNSLQLILLTGEALERKTIRRWKAHLDDSTTIFNLYSQTESAGTISYHAISQEPEDPNGIVPLGCPIKGTTVHLLDTNFRSVETVEPGYICVGGDRIARGYLNRPDLTAERFIPDASIHLFGGRVHNTGDLARYRLDKSLEWVGRIDQQVKLRGYRIELGEIEMAVRRHPSVQDVVGLCREDVPGQKEVVAYIVMAKGVSNNGSLLRTYLRKQLPEYMVPSLFVFLESLPLTPNGKVDKRALPEPGIADRTHGMTYVPPYTVLEEILVHVWQEVLEIEQIGIHDNFFELGGHSLLASKVIARLRERLELDISLRLIFENPTIKQLAHCLDLQLNTVFSKETSEDLK